MFIFTLLPSQRWDVERQGDISSGPAVGFGAYLACEPSQFDAGAFRLSGSEAGLMDPQQRLLLECVADAFATTDRCVMRLNPMSTYSWFSTGNADLSNSKLP